MFDNEEEGRERVTRGDGPLRLLPLGTGGQGACLSTAFHFIDTATSSDALPIPFFAPVTVPAIAI